MRPIDQALANRLEKLILATNGKEFSSAEIDAALVDIENFVCSGANPNVQSAGDTDSYTLLGYAVWKKWSTKQFERILALKGLNVNAVSRIQRHDVSPIQILGAKDPFNLDRIKKLVEHGANVNARAYPDNHQTLLSLYIEKQRPLSEIKALLALPRMAISVGSFFGEFTKPYYDAKGSWVKKRIYVPPLQQALDQMDKSKKPMDPELFEALFCAGAPFYTKSSNGETYLEMVGRMQDAAGIKKACELKPIQDEKERKAEEARKKELAERQKREQEQQRIKLEAVRKAAEERQREARRRAKAMTVIDALKSLTLIPVTHSASRQLRTAIINKLSTWEYVSAEAIADVLREEFYHAKQAATLSAKMVGKIEEIINSLVPGALVDSVITEFELLSNEGGEKKSSQEESSRRIAETLNHASSSREVATQTDELDSDVYEQVSNVASSTSSSRLYPELGKMSLFSQASDTEVNLQARSPVPSAPYQTDDEVITKLAELEVCDKDPCLPSSPASTTEHNAQTPTLA